MMVIEDKGKRRSGTLDIRLVPQKIYTKEKERGIYFETSNTSI